MKFLFVPAKAGGGRAELEAVNGKPIHLIAVSGDLAWFAHEHPAGDGAGLRHGADLPGGRSLYSFR